MPVKFQAGADAFLVGDAPRRGLIPVLAMRMRDDRYGRNQRRVRRRWFASTFRRETAEADFVAAAIPPPIVILVTAAVWASAIAVTFSATILCASRCARAPPTVSRIKRMATTTLASHPTCAA